MTDHDHDEADEQIVENVTITGHPREYTDAPWLGIKPGAPWVDTDGRPIIPHTDEGHSE